MDNFSFKILFTCKHYNLMEYEYTADKTHVVDLTCKCRNSKIPKPCFIHFKNSGTGTRTQITLRFHPSFTEGKKKTVNLFLINFFFTQKIRIRIRYALLMFGSSFFKFMCGIRCIMEFFFSYKT